MSWDKDFSNISSFNYEERKYDDIYDNGPLNSFSNFVSESKQSTDKNKEKQSNTKNSNKKDFLGKKTIRRDNIRSKILNHFFQFLIDSLNDNVKKIYSYQKVLFQKINYDIRKKVNIDSVKSIMDKTIKEICEYDITSKSQLFDKRNNSDCLKLISKDLEEKFINMKILTFYKEYYLCEDEEYLKNKFGINSKTQNFKYLLEEFNDTYFEKKVYEETGKKLITHFINLKSKKKDKKNEKNIEINNTTNLENTSQSSNLEQIFCDKTLINDNLEYCPSSNKENSVTTYSSLIRTEENFQVDLFNSNYFSIFNNENYK